MKNVIVTGDSGGLGSAITAALLGKDDYTVIGISRNESEAVKLLMKEYPDRYIHLTFDLSEPDRIKNMYFSSLKAIGPIYGLVNNSAYAYDDIVTNANLSSIEKMFKVNVISPIMLTKYVIRDMVLNATKGSIVHVSSVSAHTGYKGLSMYASTKGALEAFSKGVAREWGGKGIRSNCVAPGFMETAMSISLTRDQKDRIYKRTSLGIPVDIHSTAQTIEFLLSDKALSITGTVVHADNGTI